MQNRSMGARTGLAILLAAAVTACGRTSAAPATGGGGRGGRGGDPAGGMPIVAAKVAQKDVPVDLDGIGNVEAYATISIRSQVTGLLMSVGFHEGDIVKKGDRLFAIDRRPFEAQLQQATANLARDQALLAQAEATLTRDAANAEFVQGQATRNAVLQSKGIISKGDAEQSQAQAEATAATLKADRAAIDSAKAQLAAQQAAVENAKVALGYTTISAPIDGRTGTLSAKAGSLVTANSTELVSIAQVQPVYVTFAVPATHLPEIKRHMSEGHLPVVATPQDVDAQPATGELTFVDNVVDPTTDTIKLKATFQNPDRRLWPGQFARVSLRLTTLAHAVVVPIQAVQTGQDGQFVFVVKPDQTVEQRVVKTGQRVAEDIVVDSGLAAGETIVTEGQLRLEPGSRVQVGDGRGGGGRSGRGRGQGGGRGRQGQ